MSFHSIHTRAHTSQATHPYTPIDTHLHSHTHTHTMVRAQTAKMVVNVGIEIQILTMLKVRRSDE